MKKFFLLLAVATALVAPTATSLAADLEAPPPPTDDLRPASYDWSGIYAGVGVGALCGDGTVTELSAVPPAIVSNIKGCGPKLGGWVGANWQMDHLVFGLEGDIEHAKAVSEFNSAGGDLNLGFDYLTTVRARAGYAMDNILLFGTGGYAMGRANLEIVPALGASTNQKATHHGWTVGAGLEYAVTDTIRIRGEYNFIKLGDNDSYVTCGGCTGTVDPGNMHEFRIGASYAFDWQ